jgi:hypothetical protein
LAESSPEKWTRTTDHHFSTSSIRGKCWWKALRKAICQFRCLGSWASMIAELGSGVGQGEQLADEEMTGGLEGFPGFLGHLGGIDFAHAGKRERGILLESFADFLQRVADGRWAVLPADLDAVDGEAGVSDDDIGGAGSDEVLGEALE